eukprot:CAMPEP_0172542614 /NCGR_PEP_ID=MMETSP1067-20121228/13186_1 /TAXON_ID=265564 ORGANISM="Thalassiosira punctigera, Strain Tpunct2005C2" /NCGR_SAMPLE_ID=MMETSP1067 /ASSEMBLY_ACC=CAM_ASM_000444 /LENGTH=169 /DNA_ID=CAMNT_0013328889 /DNA_START=42 /DNA_END=551 /DNA_ORIENTATION=-
MNCSDHEEADMLYVAIPLDDEDCKSPPTIFVPSASVKVVEGKAEARPRTRSRKTLLVVAFGLWVAARALVASERRSHSHNLRGCRRHFDLGLVGRTAEDAEGDEDVEGDSERGMGGWYADDEDDAVVTGKWAGGELVVEGWADEKEGIWADDELLADEEEDAGFVPGLP